MMTMLALIMGVGLKFSLDMYVDFMLLVIVSLTLSMCVGLNNPLILTQYEVRWLGLVLRFLMMYDTCMLVLCY